MLNRTTRHLTNAMNFYRPFTISEKTYMARPRIKHYVVSRGEHSDEGFIFDEIMAIVKASKDSIVFLTQKSRIVMKPQFDLRNPGRPATHKEIENELEKISVKNILKNEKNIPLFRPEPGHVCLTLTDALGDPEEIHTVSLRPDTSKHIADGKAILHTQLYGKFSGRLFHSQRTSFSTEVGKLAALVAHKKSSIVADITVVPFSSSELSRAQLISNINKARIAPIYNLCKAIFKEKLIDNSDDISIKACLEEMRHVAETLKFKSIGLRKSDEMMLAAYACTNAAVEVCFGDPHYLAKNNFFDLSTQATVTLCCSMSLIGEHEFFEFARNLGFYDDNVALIEDIDSDKIGKLKR